MVDVREFERAVLCAFETTFADTEEDKEKMPLKQQALAYCEQVKRSAGGWRHNLALLRSTQHTQVQFYALQALQAQLSPILCAKVFSAMKEVKQLLVVGDSFNERVHSPSIMPVQTLLDHKTQATS